MTFCKKRREQSANGHTVAECVLAFAILLPIAVLVSKIGLQTERSLRESVHAAQAKRDLSNTREEIGAWAFDSVTVERIQSIPATENQGTMDSPREWPDGPREWLAVVEEVHEPILSKRVSLSLLWTPPQSNLANEVGPITFWVHKR